MILSFAGGTCTLTFPLILCYRKTRNSSTLLNIILYGKKKKSYYTYQDDSSWNAVIGGEI